jgi:hypothetical protein
MALPLAPAKARARPVILTASAMQVRREDANRQELRTTDEEAKCFLYAKKLPELNYASRFYSKMLKRLKIYPARRDARDAVVPITEGPPVELLERIQDPGGGRSQILGSYGRLMFIAGQGFLFGRNLGMGNERWSFVSSKEISLQDNKIIWRPTESGSPQEFMQGDSAQVYRMWSPSPERSGEAESPMMAALDVAEELLILSKSVRATAVSRILQGILKVPSEISFGADDAGLDDDPEENEFLADLIDHIVGAIENAGTAEAAAPFLAEGAAEFLRELEWIRMHDPQTDYLEKELRAEAVTRLSVGLDMPPEILKGLADTNHWGARQIMHDTWRSHGAPVAEQFCDDLSEAYLRPALEEMEYEDWDKVVVAYDDSEVVVSPDRTEDADRAYDRGQISDEGYLKLKGIDSAYAAKDESKRIFLAVKLRDARFLKGTQYEVEDMTPVAQLPGPQPSSDAKRPAEEGPPLPGPAGVSRQESRALSVRGAAELALMRCRELAGSKIRQANKRNTTIKAQIDGRPAATIAFILGPETITALGHDPLHLVQGGTDAFITLCMEWGIEEQQARALAQMIEVHAARTLFEPRLPAFPAGFAAHIERANEISLDREEEVVRQNNLSLARVNGMIGGELDALEVA